MVLNFQLIEQNGVTEALQTIAKKYKNCPDCSMEFNMAKIAEKIIEGKHVAVLVNNKLTVCFLKQNYN